MSAEMLRKAAKEMRERAEAAPTAPWTCRETTHGDPANGPTHMVVENSHGLISDHDYDRWGGTSAVHIASWHPAVALAVADWLEAEADEFEKLAAQSTAINLLLEFADETVAARIGIGYNTLTQALAVARAFLGEEA